MGHGHIVPAYDVNAPSQQMTPVYLTQSYIHRAEVSLVEDTQSQIVGLPQVQAPDDNRLPQVEAPDNGKFPVNQI